MLSAIKKLASRQDAAPSVSPNSGGNGSPNSGVATPNAACTPMAGSLQRRFAKGVQYNSMYQAYSHCECHPRWLSFGNLSFFSVSAIA